MLKPYLQLIRFDKPIGTMLLLWPTIWALFFATVGIPETKYVIVFALGVFLTRAAGCVINDLFDKQFDSHVERTKNRPLVTGAISQKNAIITAITLSLTAFIMALFNLSFNTIILCIPALIIYVTYPLFKRFFPIPQAYLGLAFSFGILMAFVQLQNSINIISILLFIANVFWVVGYDTIYALVDIKDDIKINIKTSAITFGKYVNIIIAICYLMFIFIMFIIGVLMQLNIYYFIGIAIAFIMFSYQILVLHTKNSTRYFNLFLLNNKIGMIITFGLYLAYAIN